jgi:uncharacterized membrane protein
MRTKTVTLIFILISLSSFAIGIFLYPQLPSVVVGHWDAAGNPNGAISKFWGLFLVPCIELFLFLLYYFIPKIDPLKNNIESFRKNYNLLWAVLSLFLFYIHLLTLYWNTGHVFSITTFLLPAFAILWLCIGYILKHTKRNWFVGIRTPWTLSSDEVWDKTHTLGGKLFQVVGICTLIGILVPKYSFLFMLIPVFIAVIITVVYSYILSKK